MPYRKVEKICPECGETFMGRPGRENCGSECGRKVAARKNRGRDFGSKAERIFFNGVAYYRYPESPKPSHRAYFQRPGKSLHVAIWEHHNGSVPEGHEIHHIDHDTLNNEPSNLAAIPISEHRKESQANRKLYDYTCALCGVEFRAYRASLSERRFCSRQHGQKYHNDARQAEKVRLRSNG